MSIPSAIIFINSDINDTSKELFTSQLMLHEIMSFEEFNNRVAADPNYPKIVNNSGSRIMVVLPDFRDFTNRDLADVVIFASHGQVAIEKNKFGPPRPSMRTLDLNIYALLRAAGSGNVVTIPGYPGDNPQLTPRYLITEEGNIVNGIYTEYDVGNPPGPHLPNPDNIYNNRDFLKRKI